MLLSWITPVHSLLILSQEVFEKLRERKSDLPVILASGFSREEDVRAMWASGLHAFLHKSYRKAELARAVDAVLSRRGNGLLARGTKLR
jgi:DNA-binding NarL/FixJ family response regulator